MPELNIALRVMRVIPSCLLTVSSRVPAFSDVSALPHCVNALSMEGETLGDSCTLSSLQSRHSMPRRRAVKSVDGLPAGLPVPFTRAYPYPRRVS